MSIGKRIEFYLERNNIQQKELAGKINMDTSVLNRIINDRRPARADELANIADALHVSIDELLGRPTFTPGLLNLEEMERHLKPEAKAALKLAREIEKNPEIKELVENIVKTLLKQKEQPK